MPGKLVKLPYDPNYQRGPANYRVVGDRGAGFYYHRGNGQWSKVDDIHKIKYKKIRRRK